MKKLLLIIGGGLLLIIVLGLVGKDSSTDQASIQTPPEKQELVAEATTKPAFEYEILARVENKADENISILIKPGETNPEGIAEEVQKSCTSLYMTTKKHLISTLNIPKCLVTTTQLNSERPGKKRIPFF